MKYKLRHRGVREGNGKQIIYERTFDAASYDVSDGVVTLKDDTGELVYAFSVSSLIYIEPADG